MNTDFLNRIKPGQLFGGLFFLTLGVLFLIYQLSDSGVEFVSLLKVWPVLLILGGIAVILKNQVTKVVLASFIGIFAAMIVFQMFTGVFGFVKNVSKIKNIKIVNRSFDTLVTHLKYDSLLKSVDLKIDVGAGEYRIGIDDSNLVSVKSDKMDRKFSITSETHDSAATVHVDMADFQINLGETNEISLIEIGLNPNPVYDMHVEVGASAGYFDFSKYKMTGFNLDLGASSMKLVLPRPYKDKMDVNLTAGAASLDLTLPDDVGVKLYADVGLGSHDFAGFNEKSDNEYYSDNYDKATKKMYIRLEGGVSSIKIARSKMD
ncbi:MAG: hypothetical protein HUU43_14370 [Ignavibacteriaceae bacterium]|nr:cell wall-active antibiotics response protein [Ignavibacteriaceae bacterium]NUM72027.1 hypothetical protein [Ignavibacteriaceae bacterium]